MLELSDIALFTLKRWQRLDVQVFLEQEGELLQMLSLLGISLQFSDGLV